MLVYRGLTNPLHTQLSDEIAVPSPEVGGLLTKEKIVDLLKGENVHFKMHEHKT